MAFVSSHFRLADPRWRKPLEWGYFTLIFLAFITNGANTAIPLGFCLILACGLCLAALAALGPPERTAAPFAAGVLLFLAFTLWIAVQILPVPAGLAFPVWRELSRFGIESTGHISAAPAESVAGWLRLALPFLTFLTGLLIFRTCPTSAPMRQNWFN